MKLKTLFLINVVIAGLFGLSFMLVPNPTMAMYGAELGPAGVFIGRLFGVSLFGWALIYWYCRDSRPSEALRAIILASIVADLLGATISLLFMFTGVVNALGWSNVIIYGGLTLGYIYFQFIKKDV